jgi:hypothetical protein
MQSDGECDAFLSHPAAFENESVVASLFRPVDHAAIAQTSIHPLSLHGANPFDYRPQPSHSAGHDLP